MYCTTPSGTRYQTGTPRRTRSRQSLLEIAIAGTSGFRSQLETQLQESGNADVLGSVEDLVIVAQVLAVLAVLWCLSACALTVFAFLGHGFGAAGGAMIGIDERRAVLVAGEVLDHLRDDVAGALDADAVAFADAEPSDLVAIV